MFDNYGHNIQPSAPEPPPRRGLTFDKAYVRTASGFVKLVQIFLNMIGFICIKVSWQWFSAIFYNIVYWFGTIVSLLLFLMYMFHFVEKFDRWPWNKLQFFYCTLVCLAFTVCAIFATTIGESIGFTVGFFGFCSIIAYGYDGYINYRTWKTGLPAQ